MRAEAVASALQAGDRVLVAALVDQADRLQIGLVAGSGAREQQGRRGFQPCGRRTRKRGFHGCDGVLQLLRLLASPAAVVIQLFQLRQGGVRLGAVALLGVGQRQLLMRGDQLAVVFDRFLIMVLRALEVVQPRIGHPRQELDVRVPRNRLDQLGEADLRLGILAGFELLDRLAIHLRGVEVRRGDARRRRAAAAAAAGHCNGCRGKAAETGQLTVDRRDAHCESPLFGTRNLPTSTSRQQAISAVSNVSPAADPPRAAACAGAGAGAGNAIQPELVAEGPAPAGGEVELAILMRTRPGWHGYWLNPGDAGLPMERRMAAAAGRRGRGRCAIRCRPG